jgi:molybdopterin-guanine dinucleotide biosynthesis protein A
VILAGGAARRFGSDKAFATWNGKKYIECVADAIRPVCGEIVILGRTEVPASTYHAVVPNARVINDVQSQGGPIIALKNSLKQVRGDWVLVVPCDAPAIVTEDAKRLIDEARKSKGFAVASTPDDVLFDMFCGPKPELEERLRTAKRLQDLLEGAGRVPFTAQEGLNINEPPQVHRTSP